MHDSNLLETLRAQIFNPESEPPAQDRSVASVPRPAAPAFPSLPDYQRYLQMEKALTDGVFENFYFVPRDDRMSAEISSHGTPHLIFSGYNYLALADDPRVVCAAQQAIEQYGTHAGAARMVGGEIALHRELEQAIASFVGHEDAVVAVGGYGANVSVIGYLLGKKDLLVHDAYAHNSGVMGGVLSGARRLAFKHNDYDALERLVDTNRAHHERVIILVEGAYSMDGDVPDLPRLVEIKERYGCWLMVDEAHSYGVLGRTGRGIAEHFGIEPSRVDISMGTLSKSFASCGGFIAGCRALIAMLRTFAPGLLLYSTGISPANTAAALQALRILEDEPERVRKLQDNARRFCASAKERNLDIGPADGQVPIVPIMIGHDNLALEVASELFRHRTIVHPIMYPVVPAGEARIRFFITAAHSEAQIIETLDRVAACLGAHTVDTCPLET